TDLAVSTLTRGERRRGPPRPAPHAILQTRPASRATSQEGVPRGRTASSPALSVDFGSEVRLRGDQRVGVAEAVVPMLQEARGGLVKQWLHVSKQRLIQRLRRRVVVRAGASLRLGH